MLDIAIVEGVRTPFAKAFGPLAAISAYELGRLVTEALLRRGGVRPDQVDQVVFGNVPVPALKLGLTDPVSGLIMGETAEVLAEDFGITRQAQDEYALQSHQRAVRAQQHDLFAEENVPVPAAMAVRDVSQDVGPRADQS